jgi:pyrroloquinoline-quinone synthase
MHILDQIVAEKHLLTHHFYQRWMEGTLTKGELQRYIQNYNPHVEAFPRYVSAVHAQCEDTDTRMALLDNLMEEEHGPENHPELWLRFGEALDLPREKVKNESCLEAAQTLKNTFLTLSQKSFAAGLGALYAYESQVPEIAKQKIEGLKKFYGVTQPRGLKFFEVHLEADQYHSQSEKTAFDRLSDVEKEEAKDACAQARDAVWNFLTALDQAEGLDTSSYQ